MRKVRRIFETTQEISFISTEKEFSLYLKSFQETCCCGLVSGGFTCFHMGGTYVEEEDGEKMARIRPYYESYTEQILH